jgi:hypothetical protein
VRVVHSEKCAIVEHRPRANVCRGCQNRTVTHLRRHRRINIPAFQRFNGGADIEQRTFVGRSGTLLAEGSNRRAAQSPQMRATSHQRAEVGSERAHIGAGGAVNRDVDHEWIVCRDNIETRHGDCASLALDLPTLSSDLMQSTAIDASRRHHRRNLHHRTDEVLRDTPADFVDIDRLHVMANGDLAISIEGVGFGAEHDLRRIRLRVTSERE